MPDKKIIQWHGCYDDGWRGIIVPEAFSHPAKMSYGLLKRILAHAKEQGWLKEGDVILDPFGGIGSTGILGAYEGYQVVCVELEQKFVNLAEQNFELHKDAWVEFGNPFPVIIQGDSRKLCELVEGADCVVGSPPFSQCHTDCSKNSKIVRKNAKDKRIHAGYEKQFHGQTPGQLGSMKLGNVDMVVSSPPYAENPGSKEELGGKVESGMVRKNPRHPGEKLYFTKYAKQDTEGNLGNLKSGDVDCVISSPPYEASLDRSKNAGRVENIKRRKKKMEYGGLASYSSNENQLGNYKGDTFWQTAKTIVEQCYQILKPGGHAIWVVKSFVRKGKIVDFPSDWQRLCESVGFKTVCIHHAMLVKETTHKTLFGHTEVKKKERKSFFRRLAESKGSPRIDYEVVLCMQRPDGSI